MTGELSARQKDVLILTSRGYRIDQIADQMGIKPETVSLHLRKARKKLRAKTNAEAIAISIRSGLI